MSRLAIWTMSAKSGSRSSSPDNRPDRTASSTSNPHKSKPASHRPALPTPLSFSRKRSFINGTTTQAEQEHDGQSTFQGHEDETLEPVQSYRPSVPPDSPDALPSIPLLPNEKPTNMEAPQTPSEPPSSHYRRGPPSAISIQPTRMPPGPSPHMSPFSRNVPSSAPLSRIPPPSGSRPLSMMAPPMERSQSIWSDSAPERGAVPSAGRAGWISPAVRSPTSVVSPGSNRRAARGRSVQMGVYRDQEGGERRHMLFGDVPRSAGFGPTPAWSSYEKNSPPMTRSESMQDQAIRSAQGRQRESESDLRFLQVVILAKLTT